MTTLDAAQIQIIWQHNPRLVLRCLTELAYAASRGHEEHAYRSFVDQLAFALACPPEEAIERMQALAWEEL